LHILGPPLLLLSKRGSHHTKFENAERKRKEVRKSWKTCRLPESDVPDQPTSMQTFVMQSIATKYK
jgi:hypothetical protein